MNRDPIGSAGNLYGYAAAAPISSADPTGLVTVRDVAGRGCFTTISVGPPEDHAVYVGSHMSAQWQPIASAFVDAAGDPLCEWIGYIQVVKGSIVLDQSTTSWGDWTVDGTADGFIPYPYPSTSNTLAYPNTASGYLDQVEIEDAGIGGPRGITGVNGVRNIDMQFETCVFCGGGKEGPKYSLEALSCPDVITTWEQLDEITIYGCFTWKTVVDRDSSFPGGYAASRTLNGVTDHNAMVNAQVTKNNVIGSKHSANFERGIGRYKRNIRTTDPNNPTP